MAISCRSEVFPGRTCMAMASPSGLGGLGMSSAGEIDAIAYMESTAVAVS
jgi:hypothetical protein